MNLGPRANLELLERPTQAPAPSAENPTKESKSENRGEFYLDPELLPLPALQSDLIALLRWAGEIRTASIPIIQRAAQALSAAAGGSEAEIRSKRARVAREAARVILERDATFWVENREVLREERGARRWLLQRMARTESRTTKTTL